MKANQIDIVSFAVLGNFEQVKHAGEAGFPRQLRGDVRKADGSDGLDFDLAVAHFVAIAGFDAGTGPDADAQCDVSVDNSLAKALGEDHTYRLQIAGYR